MTWPALIIFDLDGTLIDSAPDIHAAVNHMLAEIDRAPLPLNEVVKMIGDGTMRLVDRALAARPGAPVEHAAAHERFLAFYEADPVTLTTAYPGVMEAIPRLASLNYRLAVCTNKPEKPSRHILEAMDLSRYFDRIVGGDTTPWRKPDPRGAEQLVGELGFDATATLMVGDSEVDAETAKAAALKFVLMSYGYHRGPLADMPHDVLLDSMEELDGALFGTLRDK